MRFVPRFKRTLASGLVAAACATAGAAQAQFSGIYVFGDSLSDAGAFTNLVVGMGAPAGPAYKFTNNAGNVWNQNLAAMLGLTISRAYNVNPLTGQFVSVATGNNFAVGGARAELTPGVFPASAAISANIPSVKTQVTAFLNRGQVDPNAVYFVWAGDNDIFAQMGYVSAVGTSGVATAQAELVKAATALVTQIERLRAAGARNIVVINAVDVGPSPYAASLGAQGIQLATLLSGTYTQALASGLAGRDVLMLDPNRILSDLLANKTAYGLTNTTVPACGAASSLGCVAPTNGALFADGVHPTTLGHELIAEWMINYLAALGGIGDGANIAKLAVAAPLGRSGAAWRTADSRMRGFQNTPFKGDRIFAGGDYADARNDDAAGNEAADGNTTTFSLGYETTWGDKTLVGGTFSRERGNFDLAAGNGNLIFNETLLTLYASHRYNDNWYANALASWGKLDFASNRHIMIGDFHSVEQAEFNGSHLGAKLQGGYQMRAGTLVHGPFIGLDWERVEVDGFNEGASSNAIRVGDQRATQSHARIGYELSDEFAVGGSKLRPYAQLSYERQLNSDTNRYGIGMASTGNLLTVQQTNEKGGFGRLALGFSAQLGAKSEVSVGVSSTFDAPAGRDTALNVVFSTPL